MPSPPGAPPLHPVSPTSDKWLYVNFGGFCLAKRYFTAESCRWLRFFAHLSLIAGQISHFTLPFRHTHT